MENIALLVPNDELFRLAHDVLQEMKKQLFLMKIIESEDSVTEARQAINQGAEIIIARGLQATMIKQYTNIPVVEIVMTRQGIHDLLERAKRVLKKPNPNIAIVMFKNMACDMSGLEAECGVRLKEYFVQNPELLRPAALQAVEDKADLIIGGKTVSKVADEAGVPSLFLTNTEDAVAEAIREAFQLADTFEKGSHPFTSAEDKDKASGKRPFVNFPYQSARMQRVVDLAEMFSRTDCPKLIIEPVGTLYHAFCKAMHNKSRHSSEKLVQYDCVPGQDAYNDLFGRNGCVVEAAKGTLEINFIENLDIRSQKKLLEILMFRNVIVVSKVRELAPYLLPELYERLAAFTIRIPELKDTPEEIPYLTDIYMQTLTEHYGKYHVLTKEAMQAIQSFSWSGGRIQLESFLERLVIVEDHRNIRAEEITGLFQELYGARAENCIDTYVSGQAQVQTDAAVTKPLQNRRTAADEERERILKVLTDNMGSREKTAEMLGISKTTLWRKLKQYELL
jgi:DNA-binding NtrC family response regulator